MACEMAIVRLHDAWARFCREVVILSACGNAVTLGGSIIPAAPGISLRSEVIPRLLSTYRKRRYEPHWAESQQCIEAAKRLKIGNLSTFSAAIGATNSPIEAITHVRNFYAHRKHGSSRRALNTGVFRGAGPDVFALAAYGRAGETYVEAWSADLILVATAAIQ